MGELAYSRVYPGSIEAAARRLKHELEQRGFEILTSITVNRFLERRGRAAVDPVLLLEVSSPDHLERALAISRQAALLGPAKFVLSREEGATYVLLQRPTIATRALLPIPALVELSALAERSLQEAIDAAVGPRLAASDPPIYVAVDQTVRRWAPPGSSHPRAARARHVPMPGRRHPRLNGGRRGARYGRRVRRGNRPSSPRERATAPRSRPRGRAYGRG